MLTFRDLRTPADVEVWLAGMEERWPQRRAVMAHTSAQVAALPFPAPTVVELGVGAGLLAEVLLGDIPSLAYTGIDSSALLLACARPRLAPFGERASLLLADLSQDDWPVQVPAHFGSVAAIVSLQSLHDVGDAQAIERVYRLSHHLLAPGGLFLNADLVVPPGEEQPSQPGKLAIPHHLALLQTCGYERVACTLEEGKFGCVVGFRGD